MNKALADAVSVFNEISNYINGLEFAGVPLGTLILLIGALGALITMVANYRR